MKNFFRKPTQTSTQYSSDTAFEAHFNVSGEIELCIIDAETSLALVLVGRFNSTTLRMWQKANSVTSARIIWGQENENATQVWTRKHGFGQDY
jgi:hypothetical protein